MTKKELRKIFTEKRSRLTEAEQSKLDDLLLIQFQKLPLPDIQYLFTYYPFASKREPGTALVTRYLQFLFPSLQIAIPQIDISTGDMNAMLVNDETIYALNHYEIFEPQNGIELDHLKIDLVIVPLLAVDKEGYRVGYGKGFYDRFLAQCREEMVTVGLSYFEPIEKIEDTNAFDVPLKYCITPERLYEF